MEDIRYYFDYAAATPVDARVLKVMMPYFSDNFFNPSAPYEPAVRVRREYENAKDRIAKLIGGQKDELVMTAGATESINLAARSFLGHKVCSVIEHDSVLNAVKNGRNFSLVPVGLSGIAKVEDFVKNITDDTVFVSSALANHELGTVQPIAKLAVEINKIRQKRLLAGNKTPLVFHCDASQGFGIIDINVARLGVDLLTLNAGKIYGPKQVGLLWVRRGLNLTAQTVGGGQEGGLRSGTENVAGVMGFARAVELAEKKRKGETRRLAEIRNKMQNLILAELPQAVLAGDQKRRLANFLHISFPEIDAERLIFMLEMQHVYVATGSACSANRRTGSKVLPQIGLTESERNGSLRLTLGRFSTEEDCLEATKMIVETVKNEYKRIGK